MVRVLCGFAQPEELSQALASKTGITIDPPAPASLSVESEDVYVDQLKKENGIYPANQKGYMSRYYFENGSLLAWLGMWT